MTIKNIIYFVIFFLITFSCTPPQLVEVEQSWAEQTLKEFTLREKISQMLIYPMHLNFRNIENKQWQEINELIKTDGIGGIHLWSGNAGLSVTMLNELQCKSKVPILVDMDIERGLEQRYPEGTAISPAMAIAATGKSEYAFQSGRITALEARSVGIHWNLAPVIDVNINPDNPIINTRTFGDNPDTVAEYAVQYIRGLKSNGMLTCAKHFPGHGNTKTDSHNELTTILSDSSRIWSTELAPYKKVIDAGVDAIMISHLRAPNFQPNANTPATFSRFWIKNILRGKLGFRGAVITDALDMGSITTNFSDDYALINAINAGCNIIIQNHNYSKSINTIESAVNNGTIPIERINESALQMLRLKEKAGLHLTRNINYKTIQNNVGLASSKKIANKIAQESITLVKNDSNLIPVNFLNSNQVYIFDIYDNAINHRQSIATDFLIKNLNNVSTYIIDDSDSLSSMQPILDNLNENSTVIINSFVKTLARKGSIQFKESQAKFMNMLLERTKRSVMISYGNPYIIRDFPEISSYICSWENQPFLQEATARVVMGLNDVSGKLPIDIPDVASRGTGIILDKSPKYLQKLTVDSGKKLQTVMPYEVGAEIDSLIIMLNDAVVDSAFPGGVLLAAKDGKIFIHEAFGYHTYSKEKPIRKGTIFDLASLTKVISTTSAIMKLYDEGIIRLDDPVGRYIPEFIGESFDGLESRKIVTIKHLLKHTSGLPPFKLYYKLEGDYNTRIDSVYKTKLDSKPGEKMIYSDIGFILLGKIVERVSEKSLDQFIEDEIFFPIGMIDTDFNPSDTKMNRIVPTEYSEFEKGFIHGHVHDENAYSFGGVSGNAGLFSTADDLAIFCQMMINGGKYESKRVFRTETVELFTKLDSTNENNRCLGWDSPEGASSGGVYLSDSSYGHTGFTGTSLWIDTENEIFVILLTNAVHPSRKWKDPKYYDWRQWVHSEVYESLGFTEMNSKLKRRKNWNVE